MYFTKLSWKKLFDNCNVGEIQNFDIKLEKILIFRPEEKDKRTQLLRIHFCFVFLIKLLRLNLIYQTNIYN